MKESRKGLDPLEPWFMTVFTWMMRAREDGYHVTPEWIFKETNVDPIYVALSLDTLGACGWVQSHPDGYEITPDGGLAFYALISGTLPPTPGEV